MPSALLRDEEGRDEDGSGSDEAVEQVELVTLAAQAAPAAEGGRAQGGFFLMGPSRYRARTPPAGTHLRTR